MDQTASCCLSSGKASLAGYSKSGELAGIQYRVTPAQLEKTVTVQDKGEKFISNRSITQNLPRAKWAALDKPFPERTGHSHWHWATAEPLSRAGRTEDLFKFYARSGSLISAHLWISSFQNILPPV